MHRINSVMKIGAVGVPIDEDGYYLDWTRIRGEYAERPTSPYGCFALGNADVFIVLDFVVLPNGYYALFAVESPAGLGLHPEDLCNAHVADEVPEAAYHLVMHSIEVLERNGVVCDDPWNYFRTICTHVGHAI